MRPTIVTMLLLVHGVAAAAGAQVAPLAAPSRLQVISAAQEIIKEARYATLVTLGDDGRPQARIVDPFAPEADFSIWIATNPLTRKVSEVRRDSRVTLLYFNAVAGEYVTVPGTATLVADSAEKARHWKEEWAAFYKGGPLGDGYLLIRVRPTRLEVVSPRRGLVNDPETWRPVMVEMP